MLRSILALVFLLAGGCAIAQTGPSSAQDYVKHFEALTKLSIEVAQAMPPEKYNFKPHPESMDFGELMTHIANTNYAFCAGLKDVATPRIEHGADKDAVVKYLSSSFDYCSGVINGMTDEQMAQVHKSPDGRMPGREVLLAMFVHVAHHRGQAEIYLRDVGIVPPTYMV